MLPASTLVAAVVLFLTAWAEDSKPPSPTDAKAEADQASQDADAELRRWKLARGTERTLLERTPRPVLRWSNPQVGRVYGDVHLYSQDGRPEAVVCVYRFFVPYQSLTAECVSLSESPVTARRDERTVWSPPAAGLKFQPLPGAPHPAKDKTERLRQMRSLARDFTAELTDRRNEATGDPQTLRLLTQPVHRYQPQDAKIQDGALFAMVVGTDPEAFLVLESRVSAEGAPRWEFALVRMNRDAIQVRHGGKVVWEAAALETLGEPRAEYLALELPKP